MSFKNIIHFAKPVNDTCFTASEYASLATITQTQNSWLCAPDVGFRPEVYHVFLQSFHADIKIVN
jgi:hypothetical protein